MQTTLETSGNGHTAEIPADAFPRVLDLDIDPPVEFGGKTFTNMHLHEPSFQQVREAEVERVRDPFGNYTDASTRLYEMTLISKVSKVPRQAIDQMRVSQVDQAFIFLTSFRPPGPATGET
jgi:hypothetical protein